MTRPLSILERDIAFYEICYEYEIALLRRCAPSEEERHEKAAAALRTIIDALRAYKEIGE